MVRLCTQVGRRMSDKLKKRINRVVLRYDGMIWLALERVDAQVKNIHAITMFVQSLEKTRVNIFERTQSLILKKGISFKIVWYILYHISKTFSKIWSRS